MDQKEEIKYWKKQACFWKKENVGLSVVIFFMAQLIILLAFQVYHSWTLQMPSKVSINTMEISNLKSHVLDLERRNSRRYAYIENFYAWDELTLFRTRIKGKHTDALSLRFNPGSEKP